jgi:streptogramin lyase
MRAIARPSSSARQYFPPFFTGSFDIMANQSRRNGRWRIKARRSTKAFGRADSFHPRPECLEARRLLAVLINEFGGSNQPITPTGIALGSDGNLWFTEADVPAIGRITPSGAIESFNVGLTQSASPSGIAAGSDGALWFTDPVNGQIGRITTAGVITEFNVPGPNAEPVGITAGPDGALWFTDTGGDEIGRITTAGLITEFPIITSGANTQPLGITAGPDGALWFTELAGNQIGRITTAGQITEFSAGITPNSGLNGIALGSDGNLWFTETTVDQIGQITPDGVVTEFASGISAGAGPAGITPGPDGRLWFTESNNGNIGAITTDGSVTEFTSAVISPTDTPLGITAGPDGNLWFTAQNGDYIGRITPSGSIAQFPSPDAISPEAAPLSITAGPDEALWFTEHSDDQIGRIDTSGSITEFSSGITQGASPNSITEGPATNGTPSLYFTESNANQLGEITTAGEVTEFPISVPSGSPLGITLGPDNNLWIAENVQGFSDPLPPHIVSFSPTGNLVSDFALPAAFAGANLDQIATGPDGALWFTMFVNNDGPVTGGVIGRVTTAGVFSFFSIPEGPNETLSNPGGIVAGFNNDLWFADEGNSAIGRITTAGAITEFSQGLTPNDEPKSITAGPDGNFWFTDPADSSLESIGRITPQGIITLFTTPTIPSGPSGIALGPDDNIWFTETSAGQIGQAVLPQSISQPTGVPGNVLATVPASFVIATFVSNAASTNSTNFTASIDFGDGTSGLGDVIQVANPQGPTGTALYEVVAFHTYATVGRFTAAITIGTAAGNIEPIQVMVNANSPLSVTGLPVDGTAGLRTNTLVATFTDLDSTATLSDFTATIAWSDGTTSTGNIFNLPNLDGQSGFAVYAGHIFAAAGVFVSSVVVEDTRFGLMGFGLTTATVVAAPAFSPYNEIGPDSLTPGAGATGITQGPDGALWFTESNSGMIGRVDTSGNVTEFSNGITPDSDPTGIALGADGNLWFTQSASDQIGRITTVGVFTEFSEGITPHSDPNSITSGPDGNLWFTEFNGNQIGRITPLGVVTEFSTGLPAEFDPTSITTGPDGNLWFVGAGFSQVGRITPMGVITLFNVNSNFGFTSITAGPDGDLWFTETSDNAIGKINPTTFQVTEFTSASIVSPIDITSGPDGKLYFTGGVSTPQVEQITTSGVVTAFTTGLTLGSTPNGIAVGPDNNLYFTQVTGDRIGQVILPQASIPLFISHGQPVFAGVPFRFTIATFTQSSTVATTANFDVAINWGDGSSSLVFPVGSNGQFSIPAGHTYQSASLFHVTITVFNDAGFISTPLSLNVQPLISVIGQSINVTADRPFTMQVATLNTPLNPILFPNETYSTTINWGDGTSSPGSVHFDVDAVFPPSVIGSHVYGQAGVYQVTTTVVVTGEFEGTGSSTAPATVAPAFLSLSAPNIQAVAGALFDGTVALLTDHSRADVNQATEAAINWGDGTSPTLGTIVLLTPGTYEVVGSHTYANPGTFPLSVFVVNPMTMDEAFAMGTALVSSSGSPLSFVVTNTNDSGPGSLRQVILNVDQVGGHSITFAIPSAGIATIAVASTLPAILFPTIIDGYSQAAFEGITPSHPLVEINGQFAGSGVVPGLTFGGSSAGSFLVGVSVYGFSGPQVAVDAPEVTLIGNELGLRADGTIPQVPGGGSPAPNPASNGVDVFAFGDVIGGPALGDGNIISGNAGWGILIDGAQSTFTQIVGNLIGLDPTGSVARPNRLDGVAFLDGAGHEFVGPGNSISGNSGNGVHLFGSSADLISGNFIGTNAKGTGPIPNGNYGVAIDQGSSTIVVGGPSPFSPNLISGNAVVGVGILGGSSSIVLESNQIGTDVSGEKAIGNGIAGVLISDSPNNVVGPGNLVSGNGIASPGAGIWIEGPGSVFDRVIGDKVGTDLTGQFPLGNSLIGVLINDASDDVIGGNTLGSSNLISGNTSIGVMIAGPGASQNLVGGNLIGTNGSGSAAIGNGSTASGAGVYIDNASGNTIGGGAGFGNLISGNNFDGIQIFGTGSNGNLVQGNGVGTNLLGTGRLGNLQDGLLINGAPDTQVMGNILSANGLDGITVSGPESTSTLIQSNFIGVGVGGQPLGNATFGLLVTNGAPPPTQVNNVNLNNTLGPIRNTSVAPANPPASSATVNATAKSKKVAVVHGKPKPSSPKNIHPKAKAATTKAPSKKK